MHEHEQRPRWRRVGRRSPSLRPRRAIANGPRATASGRAPTGSGCAGSPARSCGPPPGSRPRRGAAPSSSRALVRLGWATEQSNADCERA
eukprot:6348234-Lingulodinium_polyedra.AAC.2